MFIPADTKHTQKTQQDIISIKVVTRGKEIVWLLKYYTVNQHIFVKVLISRINEFFPPCKKYISLLYTYQI